MEDVYCRELVLEDTPIEIVSFTTQTNTLFIVTLYIRTPWKALHCVYVKAVFRRSHHAVRLHVTKLRNIKGKI